MTWTCSIVVPTYNDVAHLGACLDALCSQITSGHAEVVVVDDGSTDGTADLVRSRYPWVRFVRSTANRGPGAARNLGWRTVTGEVIAFVDSDATVAPDWLVTGLAYFDDPRVGGVEGRVVVTGRNEVTPFTHWTENLRGGTYPTCNMFYRRAVLEPLGGFDERFYDPRRKVHFREDVELAFRVLDAGWQIPFAPEVLAYHPPLPGTASRPIRLARRYYFDPLLARLHPKRFAESVERHEIAGVVVRRPRHYVCLLNVACALMGIGALMRRSPAIGLAGWTGYLASLALIIYAPSRKTARLRLDLQHWLVVLATFAVVPWIYAVSYLRGWLAFRDVRPRSKVSGEGVDSSCQIDR